MADPVRVPIPVGVWTPIAANVILGLVTQLDKSPTAYYQTYVDTGNAAPVIVAPNAPGFLGVPLFLQGRVAEIAAPSPIDVYLLAIGKAGEVRVDL